MEIPPYPATRPIELSDKPLLDGIFARLQPRISEFTFANLYLFRNAHAYRLTMVKDALVIVGKGYAGGAYFLPPLVGDVGKALVTILDDGLALYGADEPFVEEYLRDKNVELMEDRDNFDYLYRRSELAQLPGNRFHKKKNRINYFTNRHTFTVDHYSEKYLERSLGLLGEWRRVRAEMESVSMTSEVKAAEEALKMAGLLGLGGLVVLVEGEVKAFALGEKLNNYTSVCHFEKAYPFLEGLYQLTDREFNRLLFTECAFVNREQDLGEPNLRQSKLSYHPAELVKKFRAVAKSSNSKAYR
ncbi:MAG: hypothetical protein FD174_2332 [Geobacteraceae bacterium]|nr:MAG: hypothetical protein FD174_2332 [Geobacteraceae bacterium]